MPRKIDKKISNLTRLVLLNVVVWALFVSLAFGSSMLIDVGKKCFGEFYKVQILPLQKAVERIKGISISFMIVIKDKVYEIAKSDKIADVSPPSPSPGTISVQEKRLLPTILEGVKKKILPQKKRISKDIVDSKDVVIVDAKDRDEDQYPDPYSETEEGDMDITVIEVPSDVSEEEDLGGKKEGVSPEEIVTPDEGVSVQTDAGDTSDTSPTIFFGGGSRSSPSDPEAPDTIPPGEEEEDDDDEDEEDEEVPIELKVKDEDETYLELTWVLSDYSDVEKICIYRRPASETEFTKIAEAAKDWLSYKDANVVGGKVYYYTVTALLNTGEETSFSNEVYGISGLTENERVLVLVNSQSPGSSEVASYYQLARRIPDENVLALPISETDEIDASSYVSEIETPLKTYLSNTQDENEILLKDKILFIATTYGVPYRYNDEGGNISSVDARLEGVFGEYPEFDPAVRFTTDKGGYIVSRLDGQSAKVVKGIIDRTLYAERYLNVLTGTAYFDKFGADKTEISSAIERAALIAGPYLPVGEAYDMRREELYNDSDLTGLELTRPQIDTLFDLAIDGATISELKTKAEDFDLTIADAQAAAERIHRASEDITDFQARDCPDAIFYYGWQDGYAPEVFNWKAGAVGCAIGSSELLDLRTEDTWLSGAIADNITAAIGVVKDVEGEDPFGGFIEPFLDGYNFAEASGLASQSPNLIRIGDPIYSLASTDPSELPPSPMPQFEDISARMNITDHTITFGWKTNIPSYGRLEWGTDLTYGFTTGEKDVLEDAEGVGWSERWHIYVGEGAGIVNAFDEAKKSYVISLSGTDDSEQYNMYTFTDSDGNELHYKESTIFGVELKADPEIPPDEQDFEITVKCETTDSPSTRYLRYVTPGMPKDPYKVSSPQHIYYDLAPLLKDGEWHGIIMDLTRDLHRTEPGTDIIEVNFIYVQTGKGDLCIDNLTFFKHRQRNIMTVEHSVTLPILSLGLDIYSQDPYTFNYRIVAEGPEGEDFLSGNQIFQLNLGSISGKVTVEGRTDYSDLVVAFQLREAGGDRHMDGYIDPANDEDVDAYGVQVALEDDGSYSLSRILPGIYDLTAKAVNSLMAARADILIEEGADVTGIDFGPLLAGDVTGNNIIDGKDEQVLLDLIAESGYDAIADLDGDGDVDNDDLILLQGNIGRIGYGGELELPPVIEPIDNIQVNEGEAITFTVKAYDANEDDLTLSGSYLGTYLTAGDDSAIEDARFIDNGDGTANFSWTPNWSQGSGNGIGGTQQYYISFTADDGMFTDEEDVVISITDIYDPIDITGLVDEVTVDEEERLELVVTANGYRGREVECSLDTSGLELWQQEQVASASIIPNEIDPDDKIEEDTYYEFTFRWTPSPTAARVDDASYHVTFIFYDGKEPQSRTLNIIVRNIPLPPEISLGLSLVREFEYAISEAFEEAHENVARYGDYLIITNANTWQNWPGDDYEDTPELKVFDISNPGNPVHKKDYFIIPRQEDGYAEYGYGSYVYDMGIRENLLYLYRGLWVGLQPDWNSYDEYYELTILDISDIENGNIVDLASYRFSVPDEVYWPNGFINDGRFVVLECLTDGNALSIIDVRDPENPNEVLLEKFEGFSWDTWQFVEKGFIEENKVYVVLDNQITIAENRGLNIYDISDIDNVVKIYDGSAEGAEADTNKVWAKDKYLYLLKPEGLEILEMLEEDGTVSFAPAASYYAEDELEANIQSFTQMIVDGSIIYLGVDGTEYDNSLDGIITLNQENLLLGLDTELLRRNDDLRLIDDEHFETIGTRPYVDFYYDKENMLLYGLRQKTSNPKCVYVDAIRIGLIREGLESDSAFYKFRWNDDIEIRAVVEDPDRGPHRLNVWIEGLPDCFEYEFDGTSILTIRRTDLPPEGVYDFVIYADDGLGEVSQPVRIEIIYTAGLHIVSNIYELYQAISDANTGDTIALQSGAYTLIDDDLKITRNIKLVGIDGPDNTTFILGDYRILIEPPGGDGYVPDVEIEGVKITGYRGSSENGPIQNHATKLNLTDCRIVDNEGIKVSAIYSSPRSQLHLKNTLIANNTNIEADSVSQYGSPSYSGYYRNYSRVHCGTLYLDGSTRLYVENSTIANNIDNSKSFIVPDETGYGQTGYGQTGYGLREIKVGYGAIHRSYCDYIQMTDSIMWGNGNGSQDISYDTRIPPSWLSSFISYYITYSDIQQSTISGRGVFNAIRQNPQFIDPANYDYTPRNPNCADMGAYFK